MLRNTIIAFLIILLIGICFTNGAHTKHKKHENNQRKIHFVTRELVTNELIEALIFVESRGNNSVVNKSSGARGCLQLMPVYIKEVNRLYDTSYDFSDAFDRAKSIEIVKKYLNYYGSKLENPTLEDLARIHNGGPNGYKNSSTKKYWKLVKRALDKN